MKGLFRSHFARLLPVLVLSVSATVSRGGGKDEAAPGNEPSTGQMQPQSPTGPGGQPSSPGSVACCCCCPSQQAITINAWFFTFTIPAYPGCDQTVLADPVVVTSGKLYVPHTDVEIPGLGRFNHINLEFTRAYNSRDNFLGVLGWGWVTNLDINLSFSGGVASFKDGDGTRYYMQPAGNITFADGHSGSGWEHGPWTIEYVSGLSAHVLTKTFGTKFVFSSTSPYRLLRIEDRQDHQIIYHRDGTGRVTSLEDSGGQPQTLTFTYNPTSGRLATVTDPLSRVWQYAQTGYNLTTVTDPLSRDTTYAYADTDIHNVTSITDVHGRTISYEYDNQDRVIEITNPDSTTKSFAYDSYLNESTMTDEESNDWSSLTTTTVWRPALPTRSPTPGNTSTTTKS